VSHFPSLVLQITNKRKSFLDSRQLIDSTIARRKEKKEIMQQVSEDLSQCFENLKRDFPDIYYVQLGGTDQQYPSLSALRELAESFGVSERTLEQTCGALLQTLYMSRQQETRMQQEIQERESAMFPTMGYEEPEPSGVPTLPYSLPVSTKTKRRLSQISPTVSPTATKMIRPTFYDLADICRQDPKQFTISELHYIFRVGEKLNEEYLQITGEPLIEGNLYDLTPKEMCELLIGYVQPSDIAAAEQSVYEEGEQFLPGTYPPLPTTAATTGIFPGMGFPSSMEAPPLEEKEEYPPPPTPYASTTETATGFPGVGYTLGSRMPSPKEEEEEEEYSRPFASQQAPIGTTTKFPGVGYTLGSRMPSLKEEEEEKEYSRPFATQQAPIGTTTRFPGVGYTLGSRMPYLEEEEFLEESW
jgi:hypothetical protein